MNVKKPVYRKILGTLLICFFVTALFAVFLPIAVACDSPPPNGTDSYNNTIAAAPPWWDEYNDAVVAAPPWWDTSTSNFISPPPWWDEYNDAVVAAPPWWDNYTNAIIEAPSWYNVSQETLGVAKNLVVDYNLIATWSSVENANLYKIIVDDRSFLTTHTQFALYNLGLENGNHTLYIYAFYQTIKNDNLLIIGGASNSNLEFMVAKNMFPSVKIAMPMDEILHQRQSPHPFPPGVAANAWQDTSISVYAAQGCATGRIMMAENSDVSIRGRGETSWRDSEDKRPFRIRFEHPQRLQYMAHSTFTARNWVFVSNHGDKSLLRNYSAYWLGRQLDGMDFAPSGQMVNVYLAGEFAGVYLVTDQLNEIVDGRLDLVSNSNPAVSEFLLEWCTRIPSQDPNGQDTNWVHPIIGRSINRIPFGIEFGGTTAANAEYVYNFLVQVNTAILSGDENRIRQWIDVDSFVDFYLLRELFACIDTHLSSMFFTIRGQGENRRLFAGPIWDFDRSAGNDRLSAPHNTPHVAEGARLNRWFRDLMAYSINGNWFRDIVRARWQTIRDQEIAQMMVQIRQKALQYQANFERNFEIFDIWGTSVFGYNRQAAEIRAIHNFTGQVDHLLNWFMLRINWLDAWL